MAQRPLDADLGEEFRARSFLLERMLAHDLLPWRGDGNDGGLSNELRTVPSCRSGRS